jgi:hypothetical protein
MNLISKQAEKFTLYNLDTNKSYQEFIQLVNHELLQEYWNKNYNRKND